MRNNHQKLSSWVNHEIELASNVIQVDTQVYYATSLREALAWLRVGKYSPYDIDNAAVTRNSRKNFLYRGQSDSTWGLETTLSRSKDKSKDIFRLKLFSSLFEMAVASVYEGDIINLAPRLNLRSGLAVAQHYGSEIGMATNLLDWSLQPEIAALFAKDDKKDKGKIFLIETEKAIDANLTIVFPPTFVSRLYKQRGVFTDFDSVDKDYLEASVISIEFDQKGKWVENELPDVLQILHEQLLPNDPWITSLIEYCKTREYDPSFNFNDKNEVVKESFMVKDFYHHPAFRQIFDMPIQFFELDEAKILSEMIRSLIIESQNGNKIENQRIKESLIKANPGLIDVIGLFY